MSTIVKSVVVTGASRGIGKAIAMAFAAQGHQLFLCARGEEGLKKLSAEITSLYPQSKVHYKAVDLSKKEEAIEFSRWCLSYVEPDILINNAGVYLMGSLIDEKDGQLESQLNTNLLSAYYVTKTLLPDMIQRGAGHIFNICSIASLSPYPSGSSYSITKYALHGYSQNLREELKPKGIKVTGVYPGATMTDSWGDFDNAKARIMEATDVASMIVASSSLSIQACVEEIVLRPVLGDL
jgi:short-subunit dehydrogenase